jgi:hypothetical protein
MIGRLALAGALVLAAAATSSAAPPPGFAALFNGRDLTGWRGGTTFDHRRLLAMPDAERTAQIAKWTASMLEVNPATGKPHWHAEGDELVNDGRGAYATTERDYGDFELLLEYKTVAGADSGIYLRGVPQIQIWDINQPDRADRPHRHPRKGSGGLFNNNPGSPGRDPLVVADKPFGEWNHVRVLMIGSRVSIWLNHSLVVDHAILENHYDRNLPAAQRRPIPARGPIQLQTHGGEIRWRNLYLREIGPEEAGRILAWRGNEGFEPIFNGRTLDGWAGAVDAVKVSDGALVWAENRGGTVYWNQELQSYLVRLRFKLPPAGNNGLAIHYPGTGRPAYDGLTELQVIDDRYEELKGKLDPRQVHGSAYGLVGAARGYQYPAGEWNFQEVTVHGSRLTVELNGTVILDADLADVDLSTAMGERPRPGIVRRSGFFGFAGHRDPVEFKDIYIKRL